MSVDRGGERLSIPVTPAPSKDGSGRIGISLAANADVRRKVASGPIQVGREGGWEGGRACDSLPLRGQA